MMPFKYCDAPDSRAAANAALQDRNRKVAIYMATVVAAVLGVSYAAVPLYKVFCQVQTRQYNLSTFLPNSLVFAGMGVRPW